MRQGSQRFEPALPLRHRPKLARLLPKTAAGQRGAKTLKTILSLDGGGVRGAISVAFLEAVERILCKDPADRVANHAQLIGGTSTGAIIGGALALGKSAEEIKAFYLELTPKIFKRSRFRIPGIQSVFDAASLKQEIIKICGDRTLDTEDLKTGFALVMKRMDTGSAWILSNNPASKFWDSPPGGEFLGNRHYRLSDLIRASTAAPHFFQPEPIQIVDDEPPGLFVDGGVTPHNNPSMALLQLATVPGYGYGWDTGVEDLRIISIGTGQIRERLDPAKARRMPAAGLAIKALAGLISDTQMQTLSMMQLLGRPRVRWTINSEVGDLTGARLGAAPLFDFIRYDVVLNRDWILENTGMALSDRDVARVRQMDNPEMVPLAYELGTRAAERLVDPAHFERLAE